MTALIILIIIILAVCVFVVCLYHTIYLIYVGISSLYHMIKDKHSLKTKGYRQDYWSKQ